MRVYNDAAIPFTKVLSVRVSELPKRKLWPGLRPEFRVEKKDSGNTQFRTGNACAKRPILPQNLKQR